MVSINVLAVRAALVTAGIGDPTANNEERPAKFAGVFAQPPDVSVIVAGRQLRRAIIVGTTNSMAALPNDVTGNRRFVAVTIAAGAPADVRHYLDANRDQLWAEALARCRDGENPRLPDDFKDIQADNNERYRSADELLETALGDWLELQGGSFRLTACAEAMGGIIRVDTKRLTAALIQEGWQSCLKRVDGKPKRVWTRA